MADREYYQIRQPPGNDTPTVQAVACGYSFFDTTLRQLLEGRDVCDRHADERPPYRRRKIRLSWLARRELFFLLARDECHYRGLL